MFELAPGMRGGFLFSRQNLVVAPQWFAFANNSRSSARALLAVIRQCGNLSCEAF